MQAAAIRRRKQMNKLKGKNKKSKPIIGQSAAKKSK
jgi:hypothetical protein